MSKVENQYIDLFESNEYMFDSSPQLLNEYRQQALQTLKEQGIPQYKSENYQRTDIESILAKDWGINIQNKKYHIEHIERYRCDLPEVNPINFTMINSQYVTQESNHKELPQGVFIGSLIQFIQQQPEIALRHYSQIAKPSHDGIVALNTLLVRDGFVIYVPKGVEVDRPIQLLNLLHSRGEEMFIRRMLIIVEEGAKVTLLSCDSSTQNVDMLSLITTEIKVCRNASFDMTDLEETSLQAKRISSLHIDIEEGATAVVNGLTLYGGKTRNNYYCNFSGEHASLTLSGLAIGSDNQHIDNYSYIRHSVPNCHCDELFKYALTDKSYGVFTGRIYVAQDAQKTEAYQNNRNLLLSETARMQSKPQLEIYADDVKCSHGMTTGQLDEDALFYMRQRGIPLDEAKQLLSIAFSEDVIHTIGLVPLQERVRYIVETRFRQKETVHCGCKCHDEGDCQCSC